jgi:protein AFG1
MKPVRNILTASQQRRLWTTTATKHHNRHRARQVTISQVLTSIPPRKRGTALNSSLAVNGNTNPHNVDHSLFNTFGSTSNRPPELSRATPLDEYRTLLDTGVLQDDDHQTRIIQKLHALHDKLLGYNPPKIPDIAASSSIVSMLSGFWYRHSVDIVQFSRVFKRHVPIPASPPDSAPKGLYLYGDVGTGKTMLMDLFYKTLPPSVTRKRRVHFHAFMIDVHKRVHAAKAAMGFNGGDPIFPVARDLASDASVLCFDEFQVH